MKNAKKQLEFEKSGDVQETLVFRGKKISVSTFQLKGRVWESVYHPGAVVMVPISDEGKILFIEQYRTSVKKILIELPAGTLEINEPAHLCAQRELQEEVGYRAQKITALGGFYSTPGFCNEFLYLFVAEGLQQSSLPKDPDEGIDLFPLELEEAKRMIQAGEIIDDKTIAGIYRYELWIREQEA